MKGFVLLNKMNLTKKKFLIVCLCCIGDIIQNIPMMRTIKKNEPSSEITFVTTNWCKQIVDMIPEIDNVIMFDIPTQKTNIYNIFKKLYHTFLLWIKFLKGNYDVGINVHFTKIIGMLFLFSRIKTRIGFEDSLFINKRIQYNDKIHETKKFLLLLEPFQYKELVEFPTINLDLDSIKTAQKILLDNNINQNNIIISIFAEGGITPGVTLDIKQLSIEKYIGFIKSTLSKNNNIRIILIAKEENGKASEIHKTINDTRVIFLSNLHLKQVAAIFSLSQVIIGGDTGIMHLASTTGTPVIMFYGPTDPNQWGPREQKHKIIFHKIECNPCYTRETVNDKRNYSGNTFLCKQKNIICMDMITVEEIENKLQEIININE